MEQKIKDYYVGLDIGTNSVGWAASLPNYEIPKFRGHRMWGSRLFDEASTAEATRMIRTSRRRLARRRDRLALLEEIFSEPIAAKDPTFFMRLKESKFHLEDKKVHEKHLLFADKEYTDQDFYNAYPTIYHLRAHLMKEAPKDIRELFLAIHHILKYRGHFLLEGELKASEHSIVEDLEELLVAPELELMIEPLSNLEDILTDQKKTKNDRKKAVKALYSADRKKASQAEQMAALVLGAKCNLEKLFDFEELKDADEQVKSIEFSSGDFEMKQGVYADALGGYMGVIEQAKKVYDSLVLLTILKGYNSISEAKVASYEKHHKDLTILKSLLKEERKAYHAMFNEDGKKDLTNYVAYIGSYKEGKRTSQADFYKSVGKALSALPDSENKKYVLEQIELQDFLPLLRIRDNGVIPYQLHLNELRLILQNASKVYSFLLEEEQGISVLKKIESLLTFRIPYYVGPLNKHSQRAWVQRKESGKVYPWNFEEKIDTTASAEEFIKRLTNKCTYLIGEDVLPKESLLYARFSLLNELNIIKIDGQPLSAEVKREYIKDVFTKAHKKQTKKALLTYLHGKGYITEQQLRDAVVTGIDDSIKTALKAHCDMERIFGEGFDHEIAENLIRWITLFGEDKKILVRKIASVYGDVLSDEKIKLICRLKYKDWGRLSRAFLTELVGIGEDGASRNIITCLEETSQNLMQVLSSYGPYLTLVEEWNNARSNPVEGLTHELVDELYISPAVKRAVWQSLKVVEEIAKIRGGAPKKIFVEVTRSNRDEKVKKDARQKALLELYKNIKDESRDWKKEISETEAGKFKAKKLYLYYLQLGRCLYSGASIDLNDLFDDSKYDIEHIYPRSITKDNSWNNLALVKSKLNRDKSDTYPYTPFHTPGNKAFWVTLRKYNLLTEEKYNRLTRTTPLSADELAGFIARQLVETSQSTKAVTTLLKKFYPHTEICYVKAEDVSDFRNNNEFIKVRELNKHHHAKDAYLNIVVGNVYHEKFTKNPKHFILSNKNPRPYNLTKMFERDLVKGEKVIWSAEASLATVNKMMDNNDVRVSRKPTIQKGALYNATVTKAGKAKVGSHYPLKTSDERLVDVVKYGGYEKIQNAYYSIFRCYKEDTDSPDTIMIAIPVHKATALDSVEKYIDYGNTILNSNNKYERLELAYKKLGIGAVIKLNGFYYYVGGKTDNNICIDPAIQVLLDKQAVTYLKRLINLIRRDKADVESENEFKVTATDNRAFYDLLTIKMTEGIFTKKARNKANELAEESAKEKFLKLNLLEQAKILLEILNLISNSKTSFDLKAIGVKTSRARQAMQLSNVDEFIIYEDSVTGLYRKEVQILPLE